MKIKNVEIRIGDIVEVIQKYDEFCHELKFDRRYIGKIREMKDYCVGKEIIIFDRELVNSKLINAEGKCFWEKVLGSFKNLGIANWGGFSGSQSFDEGEIKSIRVLK